MSKPNEYDTYIIPPNFIEGGTFFGGLLKLRNTAEALVIVLAIGIPVFSVSALTLTAIVTPGSFHRPSLSAITGMWCCPTMTCRMCSWNG